jgi:uncharacterized membrane protein YfcA
MLTTHVSKLIAFGFLGFAVGPFLPLAAAMILTSIAGNWVGKIALVRTPEAGFRIVLQFVLTAMALRLIWSAAHGAGHE